MVDHNDNVHDALALFCTTGAAYKSLKSADDALNVTPGSEDSHWASLADRSLVPLASQLLEHLARLLNVCAHVIDEQTPGPPPSKTSLPSLPNAPSLSPIKRKAKGLKDDVTAQAMPSSGSESKKESKSSSKGKTFG